jgi:ketosteroid isomerase-like protein
MATPGTEPAGAQVVRAAMAAFRAQDLDAMSGLLAPGMTFTSPQDDHLSREEFLATCFPTAGRFTSQDLLEVVEAGEQVFSRYEYVTADGRFRNVEVHTVRGGLIHQIEVYFGGRV